MARRPCLPALIAAAMLLGAATNASAAPSATALPEPIHAPSPSPSAPGSGSGEALDGILLSQDELMALPVRGDAWRAIMARVEDPRGGAYRLGARDDSNTDVLAYALAGARLGDDTMKRFVRDKIERVISLPRNADDILATLRNLQTYVISADLIGLETFDPALDARFRVWLAAEIRAPYAGGGGGGSVVSVHRTRTNNFGTHAGASRLAAALYLGDEAEFRAARDVWYGWTTGDPEYVPETAVWSGTDWQCEPGRPRGINAAGCTRDGHSIDGVLPEDQRRCGEFRWPPCSTGYVHGAADGLLLSFWMLARHGEDPWAWGEQAALRQMRWKYETGQPPDEGFRWQIPVIEAAYGIDLPGNDPTATSTSIGFADWWAGSLPAPADEPATPGWVDREPDLFPTFSWATWPGLLAVTLVAACLVAVGRRRRWLDRVRRRWHP